MTGRSLLVTALLVLVTVGAPTQPAACVTAPKVLRYKLASEETSFDPLKILAIFTRRIAVHVFESLYGYDHLACPVELKTLTAEGVSKYSTDFRTWYERVQLFQDGSSARRSSSWRNRRLWPTSPTRCA